MNIANTDLLRIATMGKVHGRFVFLCVPGIFHLVLLELDCARLGALQYWLGYVIKC